jgi:hypothetical protein
LLAHPLRAAAGLDGAPALSTAGSTLLRLTLFIAGDVLATPRGEFRKFCPIRHGA